MDRESGAGHRELKQMLIAAPLFPGRQEARHFLGVQRCGAVHAWREWQALGGVVVESGREMSKLSGCVESSAEAGDPAL